MRFHASRRLGFPRRPTWNGKSSSSRDNPLGPPSRRHRRSPPGTARRWNGSFWAEAGFQSTTAGSPGCGLKRMNPNSCQSRARCSGAATAAPSSANDAEYPARTALSRADRFPRRCREHPAAGSSARLPAASLKPAQSRRGRTLPPARVQRSRMPPWTGSHPSDRTGRRTTPNVRMRILRGPLR